MSNDDVLPFDLKVLDAVSGAHSSEKTAIKALELAAQYLRRREVMPPMLADYLADAFEMAALKRPGYQSDALLTELGMKALNRRPANISAFEVALFVDDLDHGTTERQRIYKAMQAFGVSEGTVRRYLKKGRQELAGSAPKD